MPDPLGDILDAIDAGAPPPEHREVAAETARTLLREVPILADRMAAAMNRRLVPYALLIHPAEPLPHADPLRARVRVRAAAKGLRRRLPELLFTVSPHSLKLGEIAASIGPLSLLIGTRHPGALRAGVERTLAELAGAGLRRIAELRGMQRAVRAGRGPPP